ncbi:MAG: SMP-30/gluconolactonase/LRE family protein [Candidatus Glassbacteria bacterium]|nr:SMP-30/gluconolactonase/LRE family protein [Candidatus Glassbacteria bacterium]
MRNPVPACLPALLLGFAQLAAQGLEFVSPEFAEVAGQDARVETIAAGLQFTEGPVWIDSAAGKPGYLLFSDIPADIIYRFRPGDTLSVWRSPSGNSNGLVLDASGRLVSCEHGNRRVGVSSGPGPAATLCDSYRGLPLNSPNDAAVGADSGIWFTDPPYGIKAGEQRQPANFVFYLPPGQKEPRAMVDDFDRPNGIVFSPDKKVLYVADSGRPHQIRRFRVEGDSLSETGVFAVISPGGPDGMCVDSSGRLYTSAGDGVQVFSPDGKLLGKVLTPEVPTNCCFGGDGMRTLFITARPNVYQVRLKVRGLR